MSVENENRNCGCSNNNMNSCGCSNLGITDANNLSVQSVNNDDNMSCSCNQSNRAEMLYKIKSLEFAVIELALYLDTHPDDTQAICLHNRYCKELKELKDSYQKVYGPLTINYPCNKWRWLEEPWPWEGGIL